MRFSSLRDCQPSHATNGTCAVAQTLCGAHGSFRAASISANMVVGRTDRSTLAEPLHAHKARILGVSFRLAPADVLGRAFIELLMEVGKRAILLEHGVHPMICNENVSLTRQRIHGRCRCETGGRTTVVVVPTHCKLSPTGPVQGGLHLHPAGRHLRLGPWSTPRVWPGGCL